MLFHIDVAERFAHDLTFESLRDDLMRLYAVIRSLEISVQLDEQACSR
jgi:uncharacterized protein with HEPN domain